MSTDTSSERLVFGVTLNQSDELDRLIGGIAAQGDVISTGIRDLDDRSLPALGWAIYHAANAIGEIFDKIGEQTLENKDTTPPPVASQANLPTFDSDMHETLLRAYSITQLMNIAAHQGDDMEEASGACRLVPDLLWKVQEYIAANFDSLPKETQDG
jgi:hypothetical protein